MDAIETFARHAADTTYEALPAQAIQATKIFMLDSFGVGVVGSAGPRAKELIDVQSSWGSDEQSRVWVRGNALPAPATAMCNAYQIHNSEFDCVHEGAVVHIMTVMLASAIAVAERKRGVSGRELITALAAGADVGCGIAIASRVPMRFFRPATAGAFAATTVVGKLLDFDAETLVNAYGVLYGQLCGTMQAHTEASTLLAMQMGFNARNAIVACDMAAHGLDGPRQVLEGEVWLLRLVRRRVRSVRGVVRTR